MRIHSKTTEILYNDFEENDGKFDSEKYLTALKNCKNFEEYLNILTKEHYDFLARSVNDNHDLIDMLV